MTAVCTCTCTCRYAVTIMGRSETTAVAAAAQLACHPEQHAPHCGLACDVSEAESVRDAFSTALSTVERQTPLVLVNSAGVAIDSLLARTTDAHIDAQCRTNLYGAMHTSRAVLRHMMRARNGCIVNIGSVVAQSGAPGQSVYAATKAGLEGFSRSLARELGPLNIRVNVVAPGFIETDMTADLSEARVTAVLSRVPLGRLGRVDDVADAVMFLIRAGYVTGSVLTMDGGLSC